jgi:hypothetical protein
VRHFTYTYIQYTLFPVHIVYIHPLILPREPFMVHFTRRLYRPPLFISAISKGRGGGGFLPPFLAHPLLTTEPPWWGGLVGRVVCRQICRGGGGEHQQTGFRAELRSVTSEHSPGQHVPAGAPPAPLIHSLCESQQSLYSNHHGASAGCARPSWGAGDAHLRRLRRAHAHHRLVPGRPAN